MKGRMEETKPKSDELKESTKQLKDESLLAAQASKEQAAALDKVTEATIRTLSSDLAYEQAVNRLRDAAADLDDKERALSVAIRDHGAASNEAEAANRTLRDAHIGIKDAALNAAGAAVRLAEDTATATGASLSAEDRARIFRDKLYELADQAGASGGAIRGLADNIRNIPNRDVLVTITQVRRFIDDPGTAQRKAEGYYGPAYAEGGVVKGPYKGAPVRATVHAGEGVLTVEQMDAIRAGSGPGGASWPAAGGVTINLSVTAGTVVGAGGAQELAHLVRDELLRLQRRLPGLGLS